MSFSEQLITIAVVILGTMTTRFLPFIIFPTDKKTPPLINYLGKVLPSAVMGLLVIYSLKDVNLFSYPYGLPEAMAIALIISLQLLCKSLLFTITGGTIAYMLLVQYLFI
ncbi:MAG: AzlD domain-containing protein [Phascolarctobacterium sp.]|nr:AzlD domain-containing protein [Phascolarctobacterium sp.]